MPIGEGESPPGDLQPADLAVFESLAAGNAWLRSLLCTLARRGLKFESENEARAAAVLDALAAWPWYKAGQFLFDLMEWEDFMLDGPAPPVLATALDPRALERLTDALRRVKSQLDGAGGAALAMPGVARSPAGATQRDGYDDASLPPIMASQYLYQYVVLGVWQALVEANAE